MWLNRLGTGHFNFLIDLEKLNSIESVKYGYMGICIYDIGWHPAVISNFYNINHREAVCYWNFVA